MAKNYFDLFGLTTNFCIDQALLSSQYLVLQRATHPDRHANKTDREQLIAQQKAAEVNDAYQTLKAPLSRAKHLLQLIGFEINVDSTTVKDPQLLMQQMMWRERLEDLGGQPEITALDSLSQEIQEELQGIQEQFRQAFDSLVQDNGGLEKCRQLVLQGEVFDTGIAAQTCVLNMQFMDKLLHAVRDLERQMLEAF